MAGQPPPPPPVPPVWLFKKKLNSRDVATVDVLSQVVIEECREEMKTVLINLVEEERFFHLRIMAEDPMGDSYELHFAYYDAGNYAVFHQWGDVVTSNDLREGDTVECWGNFVGDDNEIHATLEFRRENQDSKIKVLLKLPIIPTTANRRPESKPDGGEKRAPKKLDLLFEKKLDDVDVDPFLGELQFTRCNKKLKTALEETSSIVVSTTVDPNNKVKRTHLILTRYVTGDRYALYHAWRQVVAENGLKIGDTVVGYGNHVGWGEFRVKLYVLRDKPPPSDVNKDDEGRKDDDEGRKKEEERKKDEKRKKDEERKKEEGRKNDAGRLNLLLLGKDSTAVIGRMVIGSSEEVEEVVVVAREVEMEGCYDDEGRGFARFSAGGANGVKYEWSEEVDGGELSKSVGGAVAGNGEVRMKIDVYKSRY